MKTHDVIVMVVLAVAEFALGVYCGLAVAAWRAERPTEAPAVVQMVARDACPDWDVRR